MFKRPSPFKHGSKSCTLPCFVNTPTRVSELIVNMNKPILSAPVRPLVPIADYEGYAHALLKNGMPAEKVELVYKQHEEAMQAYKKEVPMKEPKMHRCEPIVPVCVMLRVNEAKGKVTVRLDTLTSGVYEKYFAKGKRPPLGEYVRSLVKRGYTEDQCVKVMEKYKWYEEHQEELEEELERRWPSAKGRKAAVVKKVLKAVKKV